jgi:hypothetical protein
MRPSSSQAKLLAMDALDDLQRTVLDGLYTYRIPVAAGLAALGVLALAFAGRAGWFASARRHPFRTGAMLVVVLAVALPVGWYLASPIWIRTELVEPDPVAAATAQVPEPTASRTADVNRPSAVPASVTASDPPKVTATPFAVRRIAAGPFSGTDDFHFGKGTATIIETAPGAFVLRLDAFSVRNGPDLYVYLSPDRDDYARGALEVGALKATDGAFDYELPAGTDPADFASAIIWCKQFSHLFAVAPLDAI